MTIDLGLKCHEVERYILVKPVAQSAARYVIGLGKEVLTPLEACSSSACTSRCRVTEGPDLAGPEHETESPIWVRGHANQKVSIRVTCPGPDYCFDLGALERGSR